jgi:isopenicillin N synthase-like dioxygenase
VTKPFTSVPVIDIAPFLSGDAADKRTVADAVARACETIGFLYIDGHGFDPALIDRASAAARAFYVLPDDEKRKVEMNRFPNHRGYVGQFHGKPGSRHDFARWESFKVGFETPRDDPEFQAGVRFYGPNAWPTEPADFQPAMEAYYAAMLALSRTLFRLFACALDLDEEHFIPFTGKPASIMNVNHYLGRGNTGSDQPTGLGAHSDYECFAILWQDGSGGLQLQNQAGDWIDAPPIPGTFVINIGDMLAHWSNDRFASTQHRVVYGGEGNRLSIAHFANCDYTTPVACLPTCTGPGNPPKYAPTTVGEHLITSVKRAYSDVEAYKS